EYRRHAADTPKHLGQGMAPTPEAQRGGYQDVLMFGKVNVKGGLTGGCAHCVITTTFAKCGGRYSPSRVRWRR
ncbi:hypothetical protein LEP16_26105, partial [Salmonella enterica]|uniref:hypothetical protein n=1 Tax=Salmonella enterica TaxID=28901 RepID=UPI001CE02A02